MSVGIANRQSPDKLAALVSELGEALVPQDVSDALRSDILIFAIPFSVRAWCGRRQGIQYAASGRPRDRPANCRGASGTLSLCLRYRFLSAYDTDAATVVSDLILRLGFAPVSLGNPDQGGLLQQRGGVFFLAQLVAEDTPSSGSAREPHLPGAKPIPAL
jgi:8-hydroxy-5-deazaflavin:NADPH oxidoreductase